MSRRSFLGQTIPRQHGAWTILVAAFVLGTAEGRPGVEVLLLGMSVLFAFLTQHVLELWLKLSQTDSRRKKVPPFILAYLIGAVAPAAVLILQYKRPGLAAMALAGLALVALSLVLSRQRKDRTTVGELLNVACLSMVLPATTYASVGFLPRSALGLWVLAAMFFGGSIFHVRFLVRSRKASTGSLGSRLEAGWKSIAYHAGTLVVALALTRRGYLPPMAPLALVPATLKAVAAVLRHRRAPAAIRAIGYTELGHTLIFLALALLLALQA